MTDKELQVKQRQEVRQTGESTKPERQYVPAVDIFESSDAVTVRAEMPGVPKGGVRIGLEEGTLTIEGARADAAGSAETFLLREFETGHYLRRFTMAETIDQDKIEATMTNGILTVVLPKREQAKPRQIEVKAG
ncbi:MAG: heat-shock protein Hsp20 [Deltaproteobacteria bacterium CG_4_10_14_3_um_filter_60_8]|nr:MAG: heat-shock protein Hsp20 [Desulfobacterales bacterium CG2_30_60_27]PIY24978.1 MAG: heat-shock protein Hsp20 [Deltaproteobacteria bacterium CG_4_10_14_3_um_filter_60_8]